MITKFNLYNESRRTVLNNSILNDIRTYIEEEHTWEEVMYKLSSNWNSVNNVDVFKVLIDLNQTDIINAIVLDEGFEEGDDLAANMWTDISDRETFEIMWYAFQQKKYQYIHPFITRDTSTNLITFALEKDEYWPIIEWLENKVKPLKLHFDREKYIHCVFDKTDNHNILAEQNFINLLKRNCKIDENFLNIYASSEINKIFKIIVDNFDISEIMNLFEKDIWNKVNTYAPEWFVEEYGHLFEFQHYTKTFDE